MNRIFGALIALFAGLAANAQSAGQITGAVQDKSGAVVPGAAVRAVNEGTGLISAAVSDADGRFTLVQLPVGEYRVEVTRGPWWRCRRSYIMEDWRRRSSDARW